MIATRPLFRFLRVFCRPVRFTVAGLLVAAPVTGAAQGAILHATDTVVTRQVRSMENIALAHRLAVYGQRAHRPLALATAAEILLINPMRALPSSPIDTAPAGGVGPDPRRLLAIARSMATGDDRLLAVIQPLERRAGDVPRGSTGGPRQLHAQVAAATTREHTVEFRANQAAIVYVSGDGDSDLDLFVYDEAGQLVASATGAGDQCVVHWRPERQARFRIEIRNLGQAPNQYWLTTN